MLIAIDLKHKLTKNGHKDMNKFCTKCQTDKDVSEYYKLSKSEGGLQNWCKLCMNANYAYNKNKRLTNGPSIIRDAKVCRDCNTRKPINQFHIKRGHSADGYGSYCKPCWVKRTIMNQKNALAKKGKG